MDSATLLGKALGWLGVKEDRRVAGEPDFDAAELVAPAVVEWVEGLPGVDFVTTTDVDTGEQVITEWDKRAELGAVMLTARLIRRRNSPAGVEAFTADGVAYVRRTDPDVANLLRLNYPQIG